jgi:hypothetical protein
VSRCHPATVGADALDHSTSRKPAAFRVVLADPPWLFRSNSQAAPERNPRRHPCLTVDQLCQRPLAEQVSRDAVLFPCVPGPLLVIGAHLPLIKTWGFRPTAMGFVPIKLRPLADPSNFPLADLHIGTCFTTRKNAE